MANLNEQGKQKINWFRVFTRIIGSIVGAFYFLVFIVGTIFPEEPAKFDLEFTILLALISTAISGIIIAWWKERVGGIITIIAAIVIMIFAFCSPSPYPIALSEKLRTMLVVGEPLLLTGILFLLSAQKKK
jgi:hypothetical protein